MEPADSGISDPGTAEAWPVSRPGARPWSLPGAWSATPMWGPGAVVYGETGGVGDLNTNNHAESNFSDMRHSPRRRGRRRGAVVVVLKRELQLVKNLFLILLLHSDNTQ